MLYLNLVRYSIPNVQFYRNANKIKALAFLLLKMLWQELLIIYYNLPTKRVLFVSFITLITKYLLSIWKVIKPS